MQNKPNFRKSQMYLNIYSQKVYENKCNWTLGENKANSNLVLSVVEWAKQTQNKPCPERIEFTLSVIEGNGPISKQLPFTSYLRGGVLNGFTCKKVLNKTRFELLFS
jgi:hypothetical protein